MTKLTTSVSIGLSGLAGKPNISSTESEGWIADPRTPVKKYAALLFKLAGIRHQLLQQLNREFNQIEIIDAAWEAFDSKSMLTKQVRPEFASSAPNRKEKKNHLRKSHGAISPRPKSFHDDSLWYTTFVESSIQPLIDGDIEQVNLGPL